MSAARCKALMDTVRYLLTRNGCRRRLAALVIDGLTVKAENRDVLNYLRLPRASGSALL